MCCICWYLKRGRQEPEETSDDSIYEFKADTKIEQPTQV
jgi:hypothetical protein